MVNIPLELQPEGGPKPKQPVNPGETVNWVTDRFEVEFIGFDPQDGISQGPPDNNPFVELPKITDNTVKNPVPFGDYFYEVHLNGKLAGEGSLPIPRDPPGSTGTPANPGNG